MRIDGKRVKASRFFMGNEYKIQVEKLCAIIMAKNMASTESSVRSGVVPSFNEAQSGVFPF
jgi:hypothetical protein